MFHIPKGKRKPQNKITSLYILADIAEVNIKSVTSVLFYFILFSLSEKWSSGEKEEMNFREVRTWLVVYIL